MLNTQYATLCYLIAICSVLVSTQQFQMSVKSAPMLFSNKQFMDHVRLKRTERSFGTKLAEIHPNAKRYYGLVRTLIQGKLVFLEFMDIQLTIYYKKVRIIVLIFLKYLKVVCRF